MKTKEILLWLLLVLSLSSLPGCDLFSCGDGDNPYSPPEEETSE